MEYNKHYLMNKIELLITLLVDDPHKNKYEMLSMLYNILHQLQSTKCDLVEIEESESRFMNILIKKLHANKYDNIFLIKV